VAAICWNIDGCCGAPRAEPGEVTVAGGGAAAERAGTLGVGAGRDGGETLLLWAGGGLAERPRLTILLLFYCLN